MAGRNKIEVAVLADVSGYQRGLRQASSETEGFGSKLGGVAKTGMLAFAGGVAVAAGVLGESVKAAMGAQASQAALDQALRTTHQSVAGMTPALEEAAAASRKMGFTDEDAEKALTRLELATGNTKKAVADLSVAQDIARVKHLDLVTASGTLAQAMTGSQRAAKQLGIVVQPVTKNVDELKDSHVKLSKEAERAALAHAKLLDKMATGQAVIDATRDKVRGQAQAFAETAQGAMAQFHAQLDSLEVTLGTALLPALTRVTTALADGVAWLQQSKGAHEAVAEAGRGLAVVFRLIGEAIDWVRAHWAEITADATKAMSTLQSVVQGAVTVILALWHTFGGTLTSALQGSVQNIIQILTGAFNVVEGLFRLVGDLIHGRWAKVWQDVQQIVKGAWQIVEGVFRQALNTLVTIATLIGTGIMKAVGAGLAGLANLMGRLVNAGVAAVRNLISAAASAAVALGLAVVNGIKNGLEALPGVTVKLITDLASGISTAAMAALGEAAAIGAAIVTGILSGLGDLVGRVGSAVAHGVGGAISWAKNNIGSTADEVTHRDIGVPMAKGIIDGFILGSANLPSKMKDTVRNAIEAARTAITSARGSFGTAWQQLTNDALAAFDAATNRMMAKLDAQRGQLTASEKKLQDLESSHDEEARQKAIADAQARLADAQAGGDPAAVVAAQQALDDALYAEQVANLERQAAAERAAKDKKYANKELQLQAERDLERRHFEQHLAELEAQLEREGATHKKAQEKIIRLLKSFGVSYKQAGKDLGLAFARGLDESAGAVERSAANLASIVAKYLKTNSPSELGAMSDLPSWWKGFAPALVGGLDVSMIQGTVSQASTPAGFVTAAGTGGSGSTVNVTVNGFVGNDQEIALRIRNALKLHGYRNVEVGLT